VLAFSILDLWAIRRRTLLQAEARATNVSQVLSEYIREIFLAGDTSVRQLAVYSARAGGPTAPASEWLPILASARAALKGIGSVSVIDAAGIIRHSSQPRIIGQSRADEYVFLRLKALTSDQLVVGPPFLTISDPKQLLIPFGRRLVDTDGRFLGGIVATAIPEEGRSLFRTANVGEHGTVWIFHPNGLVLFREPSTANPTGESALDNPLFKAALRHDGPGTLRGPLEAGGGEFISGFQRLSRPPVIVAVSL
jgi:hypothetical protein